MYAYVTISSMEAYGIGLKTASHSRQGGESQGRNNASSAALRKLTGPGMPFAGLFGSSSMGSPAAAPPPAAVPAPMPACKPASEAAQTAAPLPSGMAKGASARMPGRHHSTSQPQVFSSGAAARPHDSLSHAGVAGAPSATNNVEGGARGSQSSFGNATPVQEPASTPPMSSGATRGASPASRESPPFLAYPKQEPEQQAAAAGRSNGRVLSSGGGCWVPLVTPKVAALARKLLEYEVLTSAILSAFMAVSTLEIQVQECCRWVWFSTRLIAVWAGFV